MVVFLVYVDVCMKYAMDDQAMNNSATPCEANVAFYEVEIIIEIAELKTENINNLQRNRMSMAKDRLACRWQNMDELTK